MTTAKITSKGQITIPQRVRDELNLEAGVRMEFVIEEDGSLRLTPLTRSVRDLYGMLHRKGAKPVSLEDMDRAIEEHHARENERVRGRK